VGLNLFHVPFPHGKSGQPAAAHVGLGAILECGRSWVLLNIMELYAKAHF
jgi:hypothetical protein